jgi:glycosyltransferase involved in cell wall biosynthesis
VDATLPKISVVIPCYNAQKYIEKTLLSVARQDYPNLEVVVVDGGSTDGTLETVRATSIAGLRLISEPDRGQLDAVQKGLRLATGEVFYWLNADDILMPGSLQLVGRLFAEDPTLDLVYSDDFAFDEESHELHVGATIRGLGYFEHLYFYRQLYSECVFWRGARNRLLPESFYHLRQCTDFAFFANLRYGLNERWVSKRLGAFRIVPGQVSQMFKSRRDTERFFIRQNLYAQHGWSRGGVLLRAILNAPRFFIVQFCFRILERGVRKVGRVLSGDAKRKKMAHQFFSSWLNAAAEGGRDVDARILER